MTRTRFMPAEELIEISKVVIRQITLLSSLSNPQNPWPTAELGWVTRQERKLDSRARFRTLDTEKNSLQKSASTASWKCDKL